MSENIKIIEMKGIILVKKQKTQHQQLNNLIKLAKQYGNPEKKKEQVKKLKNLKKFYKK